MRCSDCDTCRVVTQTLFEGLSIDEFMKLGLRRHCRTYRKKEVIFRETEPARRLFCVLSGWVKVWKMTAEGHMQIVRWAGPGDPLGYRSMMAGEEYRASAAAATRAVICILEKSDLRRLVLGHPVLADNLMARLSQDLGNAEERLLEMAHRPVRQRLARLLLQLDSQKPDGFHMTRLDMAQLIGTSPETLIRLLTEFHDNELLRRSRKGFELLAPDKLEALAGEEPAPEIVPGAGGHI